MSSLHGCEMELVVYCSIPSYMFLSILGPSTHEQSKVLLPTTSREGNVIQTGLFFIKGNVLACLAYLVVVIVYCNVPLSGMALYISTVCIFIGWE